MAQLGCLGANPRGTRAPTRNPTPHFTEIPRHHAREFQDTRPYSLDRAPPLEGRRQFCVDSALDTASLTPFTGTGARIDVGSQPGPSGIRANRRTDVFAAANPGSLRT